MTCGFAGFGVGICALIRGHSGRVPYVRRVKTSSGAIAVQIVYSYHRGARQIEHIGSAHDDAGVEAAGGCRRQRLAARQGLLDLGPGFGAGAGGPLPITSSRTGCVLDGLAWPSLSQGVGKVLAGW